MAKATTAADMLADLADARRDKLERFLGEDAKRASLFWEFFDGAYAARIPLNRAMARWEQDFGPMPCAQSHLRNLLSARQKPRG